MKSAAILRSLPVAALAAVLAGCVAGGDTATDADTDPFSAAQSTEAARRTDLARWVRLDSSPPGTHAEVRFDARGSSPDVSYVDVVVHGFYVETKKGPDGVYSKIVVPGLGAIAKPGAPALPVARVDLAVATDAKHVRIERIERIDARHSKPRSFPKVHVWPAPRPELDSPVGGVPEAFQKDRQIYAQRHPWPGVAGQGHEVRSKLDSIRGVTAELFPFEWNPVTQKLDVTPRARFAISHAGAIGQQSPMTKDRGALASSKFANWPVVGPHFPVNRSFFQANFLFIYPDGYQAAMKPLVNQKKARGFDVTEMTTTQTGNTCASIRSAIKTWHDAGFSWTDKYALLVGNVATIPNCTSPTDVPTDDLYASTDGDDLDREVFLGRLSVQSTTDASNQVAKILKYEDHPELFFNYGRALLVAHKQDAPGKYEAAQEAVRTASYAVPPFFTTAYGSSASVTDATVSSAIDNGLGLVAYRGHGSKTEWWAWNKDDASYVDADVQGLTNVATRAPVVWSFACSNAELGAGDSIAETWMSDVNKGAVSHYGATVPSGTSANHILDKEMFKAVYDLGLTSQSHAIYHAEAKTLLSDTGNAWMYLLLGDPDMAIRREAPLRIRLVLPEAVSVCPVEGCRLDVRVIDERGNPIPDALVSAFKAGGESGRPEVHVNRYADKSGHAVLPMSTKTAGELTVVVRDGKGNTTTKVVAVR